MTSWQPIVLPVCVLGGALVLAGGLTWAERRILALWQDRLGPNRVGPFGVFQVVADIIKLFFKEDWVPPFSDKAVFVVAPAIVIMAALMTLAVLPLAPGLVVADLNIGLLFFLAMSSLGVYGVALGGWASNNKFSLLGSLRAVGQMVSYEVFMGLSLMGVVIQAGSFRLEDIVQAQAGLWYCVPQVLGMLIFFIAMLAEMRRIPFDLPEAEAELVAGYHTEYSGMKFAMFFLGEYVGITLSSAFMVTLFFGGYLGPWFPPLVWFLLKTFLLVGLFMLVRGALPRLRFDQLMRLGWTVLLPLSILNLAVTGLFVLLKTNGGR